MKKSASVPVGLVAMVAAMALQAGCGSGSAPTHQRLCGDGKGVRFEDEKCEEESMRAHLRETAAQAGIETFGLSIEELGPVTRTCSRPTSVAGSSTRLPPE